MEQQQLWVEPVGKIIVARIRGECTEALLKECQERVLMLVKETRRALVLYDALEMEAPSVDLLLLQQKLDLETKAALGEIPLRKAILVPDSRLAYMSRIAFGEFGEGEYRVFYNDLAQAIRWLED
jgi:hypothetical protein